MKTSTIVIATLTALLSMPAFAGNTTTPMQCNLTCATDFSTPASKASSGAIDEDAAEPNEPVKPAQQGGATSVEELIKRQNATGNTYGITADASLVATEVDSTGSTNTGFDFVAECLKYQGKIWEWREIKCKSMSPDWKSPGLGNFIQQ